MSVSGTSRTKRKSRRRFLKRSAGTLAGAAVGGCAVSRGEEREKETQSAPPASLHVEGREKIRVGLIGCGSRGTGAAVQALRADGAAELVAMADTFPDRIQRSLASIERTNVKDRVRVPPEHRFLDFDGYKKLLPFVDVVLLASPPHFRPEHLAAAVDAGKHVFCEKPVAVDGPGVRSVMATCAKAKKAGLSIVSGLCWRYHAGMRATFEKIHEGYVGDIVTIQATYHANGLWKHDRQPSWSDMEWQVRNWIYFTWLAGDIIAEQHIHSLDKIAWALGDKYPKAAYGQGGRTVRTGREYGNVFDHFSVVYEYEDGLRAFSSCRQWDGCRTDVSDHVYGTKGVCHIFKHQIVGERPWRFKGRSKNMYQVEHDELFRSIREGKPINNGDYMAKSTLMAIMGRMSAYTGKAVTWEQALHSKTRLGPETYEWGPIEIPEVAVPGVTRIA